MKKHILIFVVSFSLFSCQEDISLYTSFTPPVINTTEVKGVSSISATVQATIIEDGGAVVPEGGFCWSTKPNPTLSDSITNEKVWNGGFTSYLTGLKSNTTYYIRAYAKNKAGIGYGNEIAFTTRSQLTPRYGGTVTDIDGNIYHTDTIGSQIWMVENLKTTKFRNGVSIPNVTDPKTWAELRKGAYCDFNNNPVNSEIYGRLYNCHAVIDYRYLAPAGWHIPTDEEWSTLINYLGGREGAGGQLKEAGHAHWKSPNFGATNETGFTALPGGYRTYESFCSLGCVGHWWSSSATYNGKYISLDYYFTFAINSGDPKEFGMSVRCIKD